MKGKVGLVIGLGVGYVLGSRAGRERYEQIKTQWLKVWNLDPVQAQVHKVQDFAKEQAMAIPGALWGGAVKIVRAASDSGTPGQRLDSAIDASKDAADDVAEAVESTADAAASAAKKPATTRKPAAKKPAAKKTAPKKSGS